MRILLARPRGACAGVERAVEVVERALERFGPPIHVRHEIVHNRRVVNSLRARGAVFVDEVDEIPEGAITVFSAHGVSREVEEDARARRLQVIDATCPLVAKVHIETWNYARQGRQVVLVGHKGHPEVEGTSGRAPGAVLLVSSVEDVARLRVRDPEKLAWVTQTTLSVDDTRIIIEALKARFPAIVGPDKGDICYATQNRQTGVRRLAEEADVILVIGSPNSSNSNRLCEVGTEMGVPSYLADDPVGIDPAWLQGASVIGVTAGASVPEALVGEIVDHLRELTGAAVEEQDGVVERVRFKLPPALAAPA